MQRMLHYMHELKQQRARKEWMQRSSAFEPEILRLFSYVDTDGSETIELSELLQVCTKGGMLETDDIAAFHGAFAGLAARTRAGVTRFQSDDASLEAVFDYLVG